MLTSSESGRMKYALVTDDDLSKHVGHRIEVRGKATDKGDAKVTIETKVGTSGSSSAPTTRTRRRPRSKATSTSTTWA